MDLSQSRPVEKQNKIKWLNMNTYTSTTYHLTKMPKAYWKETISKMVQGALNVSMYKNDPYQSPSTTLTLNESNS